MKTITIAKGDGIGPEIMDATIKVLTEAGRLKLTVVSTGKYVMPYFLTEFLSANPSIELVMDVTNKAKVIESIHHNTVDFSLVSIVPEKLNLEKEILMKNKLFLVGNKDQQFTRRGNNLQRMEELPFIFREAGSGTRLSTESFLSKHGITIRKKIELTSNEAVKQAVIAGLGYSIMPLIGLKNELVNQSLQIIPIKGLPIISDWHLIWPKGKNMSPPAEAFLDYIRSEKQKIIQEKFKWYEKY